VPPRAALFDMDGTLISMASAVLYTRYRRERGEIGWGETARVAYWMLRYSLGVIAAERVAARVLLQFAGEDDDELRSATESWFSTHVLAHVRAAGRAAVDRHRRAGDLVAIVTASTEYAARPLARELGIDHVVATELELDASGRLTGRAVPPLCYGPGKVCRAERFLEGFGATLDQAAFYSDSITDLPLLERVGKPVVVCPDRRLSRVAARRGWPIERW